MPRPRILLADDYRPILDRIASVLATEFEIVAAVNDGEAALSAAVLLKPDAVVLDMSMPLISGLEVARHLSLLGDPPAVVFLTVYGDPALHEAAQNVGATGYVRKPHLVRDLVPALRRALAARDGALGPGTNPVTNES